MGSITGSRRTFPSQIPISKKLVAMFLSCVLLLSWQQMHLLPSVSSFSILAPTYSCRRRSSTGDSIMPSKRRDSYQTKFAATETKQHDRWIRKSLASLKASSLKEDDIVEVEELPDFQKLFSKYCDSSGFMTKATLESIPPFAVLLAEGDLLPEEWNDIWDAAPKASEGGDDTALIDLDSFVRIYRDVDDLFEDGEDDDDQIFQTEDELGTTVSTIDGNDDVDDDDDDTEDAGVIDAELEEIYQSICNDQKLISKDALKNWEEIQNLRSEGLLGDDEFDDLWERVTKSPRANDQFLDVAGFMDFNVALDGLFELSDDDEVEGDLEIVADATITPAKSRAMVEEGDMTPSVLFAKLADGNNLVGMDELRLWVELTEMLEEGDLLSSELQVMYDKALPANSSRKLTEEAFLKLYEEIDSLFDDESEVVGAIPIRANESQDAKNTAKEDLLAFLDIIRDDTDETMLPCGLDATEADKKQVLNIVNVLAEQPTNMIRQKKGNIELTDLTGKWKLLYSSSSAMKFNKGLSGIGGSFPNGRCAGVLQELKATKFLNDAEYKERIEVKPSTASFDVTVTGSWDLRTSVSLFTGQPSIVLNVEPERVNYGPTSTRADHWKSLGPLNMLDLSYLDEDLRVMRGCTSADTLFIFKKES